MAQCATHHRASTYEANPNHHHGLAASACVSLQVQDLLTEGREAAAVIRDVAVALNQTLDVLQATLGPNG